MVVYTEKGLDYGQTLRLGTHSCATEAIWLTTNTLGRPSVEGEMGGMVTIGLRWTNCTCYHQHYVTRYTLYL